MRSGPGSVRPEADQAVEYQALEECLPAAVEVAQAAAGQGLEAVGRGRPGGGAAPWGAGGAPWGAGGGPASACLSYNDGKRVQPLRCCNA